MVMGHRNVPSAAAARHLWEKQQDPPIGLTVEGPGCEVAPVVGVLNPVTGEERQPNVSAIYNQVELS